MQCELVTRKHSREETRQPDISQRDVGLPSLTSTTCTDYIDSNRSKLLPRKETISWFRVRYRTQVLINRLYVTVSHIPEYWPRHNLQ